MSTPDTPSLPFLKMQLYPAEIAKSIAPGAHALLIIDGAGWHGAQGLVAAIWGPVEAYLRGRDIVATDQTPSLRFHPACYYRPDGSGSVARLPAMLAAVTHLDGRQTGTHRTWLRADGTAKADIDTPRRAMGALLGNGVRFSGPGDVLIAGEGIETVLSVRSALPEMPALAALSSGHLAAIRFSAGLRRLYVLRDRDPAGAAARDRLAARAAEAGIEALTLTPRLADFNDDLRRYGLAALQARLRLHLHVEDAARFVPV